MAAKYELRIEPIDESHIAAYARLAVDEFGPGMAVAQPAHLRWKFLANPAGPSTGIHLYSEGELVGRYIFWPRYFTHAGKSYRAAVALDTLIDRRHRRLNVLMQLLSGIKQVSGFDLLLSIAPNEAGWQVSKKFAAIPECFELDVAVAPIGPGRILHARGTLSWVAAAVIDWPWRTLLRPVCAISGRFGRYRVTDQWPTQSALEALFDSAVVAGTLTGKRTADFVDWRFRQSPIFKYEVWFLYHGADLVGYLASRRTRYEAYDCRFLVDAFGRPDLTRRDWAAALGPLLAREAAAGAEMSMLLGTADRGSLSTVLMPPFLRVPSRFLPRRMTVFGKWLSDPGPDLTRENVYLTLADYDVA